MTAPSPIIVVSRPRRPKAAFPLQALRSNYHSQDIFLEHAAAFFVYAMRRPGCHCILNLGATHVLGRTAYNLPARHEMPRPSEISNRG